MHPAFAGIVSLQCQTSCKVHKFLIELHRRELLRVCLQVTTLLDHCYLFRLLLYMLDAFGYGVLRSWLHAEEFAV